ncbi:hypothetical protein CPAST_c15380 [Clostridium pasteurianum DSM 525 = ATCC 6013]|uniref:Uncharacterized protein n=1 Tax=Clostridium pasteurianum DSM 525 = ATCC 6013 TaxID=1262449 RepID=A0A0H3J6Q0_CLOPA|nr:hypothetical protein [Clostridium pasteurianum]AJA47613.1 hypothetical protein CPAST_c15380 [Clostridium pasteurianum DSM 525 = ATCC 6013]AJA51601.1 hypothetical protein CLPA_c15380 [Clostridium pasteurianum DSM 525 = ATCC 6013]AOZ74925.1 hypothetical protein AQ983_07435 [Clostridium pasteurianum DSM 525 = ATCC 6013]AOZ78720.1 hypothetical protein AQ984_07425 [Clostridium pasteurianum]ELP58047.1 hypothetical protein F502_16410 [Clostridium pasteurianum DSM 525 = ATCC 6013]
MTDIIINTLMSINPLYLIVGVIAIVVILKVVGKILKIVLIVGIIAFILYEAGLLSSILDFIRNINV